jgi:hypothetical protein
MRTAVLAAGALLDVESRHWLPRGDDAIRIWPPGMFVLLVENT